MIQRIQWPQRDVHIIFTDVSHNGTQGKNEYRDSDLKIEDIVSAFRQQNQRFFASSLFIIDTYCQRYLRIMIFIVD